MDDEAYLSALIKKGIAVVCYSVDEIDRLSKIVDTLYPGYGESISDYKSYLGRWDFKECLAVRLEERYSGGLDYGHDQPKYYRRRGFSVLNLSDLMPDLGEFESNSSDLSSLFGI